MKRVLVTGGAGFIGANLALEFERRGLGVVVVDDFSAGHFENLRGYAGDVIYAIKSHADYLEDCPRVSLMDKVLYACDELAGFITACALVRPGRLEGLAPKSVRKKMKSASFAAAVNRDDIVGGAADLGVDLNEHIAFVIAAMQMIAKDLDLVPDPAGD